MRRMATLFAVAATASLVAVAAAPVAGALAPLAGGEVAVVDTQRCAEPPCEKICAVYASLGLNCPLD